MSLYSTCGLTCRQPLDAIVMAALRQVVVCKNRWRGDQHPLHDLAVRLTSCSTMLSHTTPERVQ